MPTVLKSIEEGAFFSCSNLLDIVLPDSIESIGSQAFYNCRNLSITIPSTIKRIGSNAFYNVKHIYYNGNLSSSNNWGALAMN